MNIQSEPANGCLVAPRWLSLFKVKNLSNNPFHKGFLITNMNHQPTIAWDLRIYKVQKWHSCCQQFGEHVGHIEGPVPICASFWSTQKIPKYPELSRTNLNILPHQKRYAEGSIIRRCGSPPLFPLLSPFPWLFGNRPRTQGNLSSRLD